MQRELLHDSTGRICCRLSGNSSGESTVMEQLL